MIPADIIMERLLCYGLFPESISKIFSSKSFGEWAPQNMATISRSNYTKRKYSLVEYKLTRNNNTPRYIGIPNPFSYYDICECTHKNWSKIAEIFELFSNYLETSMIIPKATNKNLRLITMSSYDQPKNKEELITTKQFGKKYLVKADISSFYHSVYTHVVPWALVGRAVARTNPSDRRWFNRIDIALRSSQEKETLGLPIGCDTSALFAEIILARVDNKLKKYQYTRYVDDYNCYCSSREQAECFIRDLSRELKEYRLKLNPRKTKISELPMALNENWVGQLKLYSNIDEVNKYSKARVIAFLDLASELFNNNPDESSIRYAAKIILSKKFTDYSTYILILKYFLNLCYLYPYIIDVIDDLVEIGLNKFPVQHLAIKENLKNSLGTIIKEHSQYHRSDVMTWGIFMLIKYDIYIGDYKTIQKRIILTKDCVSCLLSYIYCKVYQLSIIEYKDVFNSRKADKSWWLYTYEYCRLEKLPLVEEELEKTRVGGISFLCKTLTEKL